MRFTYVMLPVFAYNQRSAGENENTVGFMNLVSLVSVEKSNFPGHSSFRV